MAILSNLLVRIGVDGDRVNQQLGRVSGFFERHSGKIAAAGTAIGVGGGTALVMGIQAGMQKEALGDKLAAQLGETGPEAARLGKIAGNVYSQGLGEGLDQVHDAVGAVVSSIDGMRGASNEAVQDMSTKVLNLAKAFEVDVARSAQVVGQIVKSGLVKDADQGMDLLTASLQKVPAAVREDLVDALDEYSPFMQQIGVKGQDAFELLAQSAEKGAFGIDKTGDALKEFTLRATDMSTGTAEAYDAIGLSQEKMTADLLAGGDRGAEAFQKIVTGLMGIEDPTEKAQAAIALFGTPLEDLSTQDIPAFLRSLDTTRNTLGDTAGAADEFGKTLNDNAQTGIAEWQRKTESALTSLVNAEGLMGDTAQAATGVTQALAPVGQSLGGLALTAFVAGQGLSGIGGKAKAGLSKVGGLAKSAGSRVAGFASSAGSAAANVGRGMGSAAANVGRGAAQVVSSTGRAAASVAGAAGRVAASSARMAGQAAMAAGRVAGSWALMAVQSMVRAGIMAVSWLIAFWPALLIIGIVALVVFLIIKYWDKIVAFFTETLPKWLRQGFEWIVNVIKTGAQKGFLGPVGLIIAHWDKVKNFFTKTVPDALKRFASWVVQQIKGAAQKGFLGPVGLIIAHWGKIRNFFTRTLPQAVSNAVGRVIGFMKSLPGRIKSALGNMGRLLVQAGKNVVQGLINGITSKFGGLINKARDMASKIRNVLPFSPAKDGPLSGRGSPERAGRKIGDMVASGMARGTGAVASAAAGMAGAAALDPAAAGWPGAATPAGVRAAGGDGSGTVLVIRGDDSKTGRFVVEMLRKSVAEAGGNVQTVIGRR